MASDARNTALFILNSLDKQHKTLDRILEDVFAGNPHFSRKDRSLLYVLTYGVLRWRGSLDWTIAYFSKTRLNKINPGILNILRLGLFQIIYLNKIPVSAAVNTSVEMAKSLSAPWIAKFVNALLRNASKKYKKVPFPDTDKDPAGALATKKSFPEWLIKRWLNRFGFEKTEALCNAINKIPPITIRTNRLKTTREKLIKSIEDDVEKIKRTDYAPDGVSFFRPKKSIPEIKIFKDGWFQVQDEASQIVTLLLNPGPGDIVLDACAGLGGKTGHIAQMMKNSGKIFAIDKNEEKLLLLKSEMNRLGISIVETCPYDLNKPLSKLLNQKGFTMFDHILLDAPCSGLGVLRRNPDTKWLMLKKNLVFYKKRQIAFLDRLAHFVKPSGTLVYSVCSTEPEENEEVVKYFLDKHSEFVIDNKLTGLHYDARCLVTKSGYLMTFPHLDNMDGFFSVCFKRCC